jgi:hypothetical protein
MMRKLKFSNRFGVREADTLNAAKQSQALSEHEGKKVRLVAKKA